MLQPGQLTVATSLVLRDGSRVQPTRYSVIMYIYSRMPSNFTFKTRKDNKKSVNYPSKNLHFTTDRTDDNQVFCFMFLDHLFYCFIIQFL
jgi:hypothetical protein